MKGDKFFLATKLTTIALGFALLSPLGAKADLQFQFNHVFSSSGGASSPTGSAPWLSANIHDVTPGTVTLTINTCGLQGSEFISDFYLNLDPGINPANLTFSTPTLTGSFSAPTIGKIANNFKADGDGYYDIDLGFSTSHGSTFTVGDSISYQITGGGLDAASFDFTSVMGGGAGQWLAAAHVQSIGSDTSSAWIAPITVTPTPEPGSIALLLVGGGSLWFGVRRLVSRAK